MHAEPLDERLQQLRRADLLAPALPEDPAHQRGRGDHVGQLPVLERDAEERVLAGQLVGIELGLVDVRVDPVHVVLAVLDELGADVPVQLRRVVDLALEVGLRVRGDLPLRAIHLAVRRGAARERRQLRPSRVAQHVHQEEAVLGPRVARAEQHVGAGGAVDVRHAVALVADDREAGATQRALRGLDIPRLHAEGRVLVVVGDLRVGEGRVRVHQVAVERQLVEPVLRPLAGDLELEELRAVVEAARAGREHVVEAAGVVLAVGLNGVGRMGRGRRARQRGARQHRARRRARHYFAPGGGACVLRNASKARSDSTRRIVGRSRAGTVTR